MLHAVAVAEQADAVHVMEQEIEAIPKTATKQQCIGNVQVVEVLADVTYVEVLEKYTVRIVRNTFEKL